MTCLESILAGCKMDDVTYQEMIRAARANKEYLSFIDLEPGARQTVVIEKVIRKTNVKAIGGRTEKVVDFLQLKGTEKLLWLSLGKLRSLANILGRDASKWAGQKIVLFADPSVKMKGEVVGGLVIEAVKNG